MEIEMTISIMSVIASLAALGLSIYTHFVTVIRDRKIATLDAYNRLEEQALEPLDKYMPAQIKNIASDRRLVDYKTVVAYIARIEHFCVGINNKIYDFDVTYDLSHGFLDGRIYERIKPIIEANDGSYYKNTIEVIKKMKSQDTPIKR